VHWPFQQQHSAQRQRRLTLAGRTAHPAASSGHSTPGVLPHLVLGHQGGGVAAWLWHTAGAELLQGALAAAGQRGLQLPHTEPVCVLVPSETVENSVPSAGGSFEAAAAGAARLPRAASPCTPNPSAGSSTTGWSSNRLHMSARSLLSKWAARKVGPHPGVPTPQPCSRQSLNSQPGRA
jgi:hypothetical protein